MDSALEQFMRITEESSGGLIPKVNKGMQYPFIYITELSTVELEYLAERHIISQQKTKPEDLPIFVKTEGNSYKALGFISLCFNSIIKLVCLRHHNVMLKVNKETEKSITAELMDSLLLT